MSILIGCGVIVLLLAITMIYIRAIMVVALKQSISSLKLVAICVLMSSVYMAAVIFIIKFMILTTL